MNEHEQQREELREVVKQEIEEAKGRQFLIWLGVVSVLGAVVLFVRLSVHHEPRGYFFLPVLALGVMLLESKRIMRMRESGSPSQKRRGLYLITFYFFLLFVAIIVCFVLMIMRIY